LIDSTWRVTHPRAGAAVVSLLGEHDLAVKQRLEAVLNGLVVTNDLVVVDVSESAFVDSSIINVLFACNRHAHNVGSSFRLQMGTAAIVERALQVAGALDMLEVVHNREDALKKSPTSAPG